MLLTSIKSKLRFIRNKLKRKISFGISASKLRKLDDRVIKNSCGELRLFVMARNESLRLPYFFDYYFGKGVDRVFFIDNGSTDNSIEIALSYDNVHVFQTKESFKNYSNWMEILLDRYGNGYWCIAADVDEILTFPYYESISIKQFCQFLEQEGDAALQCLFLDMYSDKPISNNTYKPGENPLDVCPFFDPSYGEENKIWMNPKHQKKFNCTRFFGNMRQRVFGLDNISLSKISLFKYDKAKVFAGRGMHAMDGVKFSPARGVTMHFKYLQDFNSRVVSEAVRGEHEGNAIDYKSYAKKVEEDADLNCYFEDSVKFTNSAKLIELGLMKSSVALDEFVKQHN